MSRILIVDDSPIMRKNLRSILTQAGHIIVSEASNGTQAYIEYNKHKPDLVTMDITMPYMNGLDTFKKIIKNDPGAKIIIISSSSDNMVILDAIQNGAKNYIIKPFVVDKVLEVVNQVLKISQKLSNETIDTIYNTIQSTDAAPQSMNRLAFDYSDFSVKTEEAEVEAHFSITLKSNTFVVQLSREITFEDMLKLLELMRGFLLVKPLKLVFDLNNIRLNDYDMITLLTDYIEKVHDANGTAIILSRNNALFNFFRTQSITAFTDFYSDLSELEL